MGNALPYMTNNFHNLSLGNVLINNFKPVQIVVITNFTHFLSRCTKYRGFLYVNHVGGLSKKHLPA